MTTTTAPTITLDDVLRALMETRNTIQANAEAVRIRFEQEAANRAEERRLLAEEMRLRDEREAKKRAEWEAEQTRLRAEREAEETKKRAEREAEQARLRAERETEAKASRMDFDKRMKELSKQIGGQANRLGEFVQEMVRPAAVRLFQERGLPVHQVLPNMEGTSRDDTVEIEIDLVVVNTQVLIAVECKSHLTQEAVDEHLERLAVFKRCFPQFEGYTVLGAVAGMVMSKEVSRYAHKNGLFVLAQSGSSIEIRNPSGFDAKEW